MVETRSRMDDFTTLISPHFGSIMQMTRNEMVSVQKRQLSIRLACDCASVIAHRRTCKGCPEKALACKGALFIGGFEKLSNNDKMMHLSWDQNCALQCRSAFR